MQLFVLGMHRSGTSMVTRLLNLMGAYFGPENVGMRPAADNPKGFWERQDVYELNENLLNNSSNSWFQISGFQLDNLSHEQKKHFQKEAARIIFEMDAHRPWVIKDPRNCLTFPLWKELLEMPICIHVHRNPFEIALSLKKRNDFPISFGIALWEEYTIRTFEATRDLPRIFVNHKKLIENPYSTVEKLFQDLQLKGIQGLRIPANKEISAFINKSLYHARDEINSQNALLTHGQKVLCKAIENEDVAWLDNIQDRGDYPGRHDLLHQYEHFQKTEKEATEVKDNLKRVSAKLREAEFELTTQREKLQEQEKVYLAISEEKQKNEEEAVAKNSRFERDKQFIAEGYDKIIQKLEVSFETRLETLFKSHSQDLATLESTRTKLQQLESSFRLEKEQLVAENKGLEQKAKVLEDHLEQLKSSFLLEKEQLIAKNEELVQKARGLKGQLEEQEASFQLEKEQLMAENEALNQNVRVFESQLKHLKLSFQAKKKELTWEKDIVFQQANTVEQYLIQAIANLNKTAVRQASVIDSIFSSESEHLEFLKKKIQHHHRELDEAHQANLKSWRWKIGDATVRSVERILGRKKPQLGVHLINDILEKLHSYTQILEPTVNMKKPRIPKLSQDHFDDVLLQLKELTTKEVEARISNRNISPKLDKNPAVNFVSQEETFRVLYISPHLPDFDTSSGGKRALRMLSLLTESCQVYAFTLGNRPYNHQCALENAGVHVFNSNSLEDVKESLSKVDAIIYAWYYTYFDCMSFTQYFPAAKIIIDTVDVHWVREERSLGILEGLTESIIQTNKRREISAYRAADIVWAVTENDKQAVLKEIPEADVRIVSNIHQAVRQQFQPAREKNILFFGGYQHYPNISAVNKLALEILPKIRQEIPNVKLLIAGSKAPPEVRDLGKLEGVDFLGFIEDTQIDDLYDRTALIIAPLLAGAGIKGKICEAATYMIPVITNTIGNEGIQLKNEVDGFITDDFDEMANYGIKIFREEYDLQLVTENARKRILDIVGPENARKAMINSLAKSVSICIVTWNRLELLKSCIESILDNTTYPNYVILVHSNGCADGTQEYLRSMAKKDSRIIPILSENNDVFVKPNNAMMQMFPENDVVLVNNDVTVTKGWLLELYRAAYSSEKVGITGAKILFPDGRLQEFGSELYGDGTGRNIGKWDDPDKAEYQSIKKAGYVSGCMMFIKRDTIRQIGVFDEQFHPCYCEDSDYCYTAWENQIETLVTPHSVIYHFEGGTSGTDTDKGFKSYQKVNMQKFIKKHRGKNNGISWGIEKESKDTPEISFCEKLNSSFNTGFSDDFGNEIISNTSLQNLPVNVFSFSIVRNYQEFIDYERKMTNVYSKRASIENEISRCNKDSTSELWGFNPMIQKKVCYKIKRRILGNGKGIINFRETVTCPVTHTNSRLRATAMAIDEAIKNTDHTELKIYFLEQKTPFFNFYRSKFPHLQGSEYFGPSFKSGEIVNEIRHEDVTKLSFSNNSFDLIVALEVLEHVPNFREGLKEIFRCLRENGKVIITVPFLNHEKKTKVRATIDEAGQIKHILPPEYHGDPVKSDKGILCFYHFGWDLIEEMKLIGFKDVKALLGWSLYHGILGKDILILQAEK